MTPEEFQLAARNALEKYNAISDPPGAFDLVDEDEDDQDEIPKRTKRPVPAAKAVMGAIVEASISRNVRRQLRHRQALAVIVEVPGPDWVEPVRAAFRTYFGPRWVMVGQASQHWPPYGKLDLSAAVASNLNEGRCVAAVCVGQADVPQALRLTADFTIRIAPPSAEVLQRAIAKFAGGSFELEEGAGQGLAYHDILSCFRPGQGARRIADRMMDATKLLTVQPDERLPNIFEAVEYGDELRKWSLELGEMVRLYRRQEISWADMPHGICVAGPPGTGKSVWARSVARFCNCPIIYSSVPEWFLAGKSGYLDDCLRAVRQTFDSAAAAARAHGGVAILMLDEVDAVPRRNSNSRNSDFWSAILAELLLRLDSGSASGRTGVIVISATNVPQALDEALLRPGRLERLVTLAPAKADGIKSMLKFQVNGDVPDAELGDVAHLIERSTAAEVMATVREARNIARRAGRPLEAADLKAAVLGEGDEKSAVDDRVVSHEAGHVVIALAIGYGRVRHCAVGARTGAPHRTLVEADEGNLATLRHVEDRVTMLLGGRAAEYALYDDCSVGSAGDETSDIGAATAAMAAARLSFCVSGPMFFHGSPREAVEAVRFDPALRAAVEADLQRLQKRANEIVEEHLGAVVAIAQALRKHRYLNGQQLQHLFDAAKPTRLVKKIGKTGA